MPPFHIPEVMGNLEGRGVQASNRFFSDINRFARGEVADAIALISGSAVYGALREVIKVPTNDYIPYLLVPVVALFVEDYLHKKFLNEDINVVRATGRLFANAVAIAVLIGAFSLFASIGESNAKAQALLPTNTASPTYTPPPTFTPTATFAPTETVTPIPTATNTPDILNKLSSVTIANPSDAWKVKQDIIDPAIKQHEDQAFAAGQQLGIEQGKQQGRFEGGVVAAIVALLAVLGINRKRQN